MFEESWSLFSQNFAEIALQQYRHAVFYELFLSFYHVSSDMISFLGSIKREQFDMVEKEHIGIKSFGTAIILKLLTHPQDW